MKKVLSVLAASFLLFQTAATAEYWKAKDLYYKFDFTDKKNPEYEVISGEWTLGRPEEAHTDIYDFEKGSTGFIPSAGVWGTENGLYLQSEEDPSKTSKAMLSNSYGDFCLSFDLFPMSAENTVMIYFGGGDDGSANSIEINSYQSKLILNGEETIGSGSILKDGEYNIKLVLNEGVLTLYLDSEPIFTKAGLSGIEGSIGIGSWNSKMAFDNFEITQLSELSSQDFLIGNGKNGAEVVFSELYADDFVISVPVAAKNIHSGKIGIGIRLDGEYGYYAGIDKNSVYITKKSAQRTEKIAEKSFKPQSGKLYNLSVVCDANKINVSVDDKEILSATDSEFSAGACSLFATSTEAYFKNVTMSLLEKIYPPVISPGETDYYVDGENGDDANDGLTPETAWKSLDRPAQCRFAAGDRLLIKRGESYEGTLKLVDFEAGADSVFTISAYGEGENPVLTSCERVISIENCKNIYISGIDIKLRHFGTPGNAWIGKGYGLYVENSENINLSDCNFYGPGEDTYSFAAETGDDRVFAELSADNVTYRDFGKNGICVAGELREKTAEDTELKGHWAYTYMKNLFQKNIISEYRPDDKITRAEFSTMLVSALSLTESEYRGIFKDIAQDAWYAPKIQTVSDYRILPTQMTEAGMARPDAPLTREEAAAMAALAAAEETDGEFQYADLSDCDAWTIEYIKTVSLLGIMSGKGDGKFYPKDSVTRAEAAVILTKLMEFGI